MKKDYYLANSEGKRNLHFVLNNLNDAIKVASKNGYSNILEYEGDVLIRDIAVRSVYGLCGSKVQLWGSLF